MRRSRREIEESEQFYKSAVENAGPYLEIAHGLQERVSARLSSVAPQELDAVLAQSVATREDELVRSGIEAKIEALPTAQMLGMYARVLGDDSVNEPLKRIATIKHRQLEREARIAELRETAVVSRMVDLTLMRTGEVLDLDLFVSPDYSGSRYISNARKFSVRKYDEDTFEVVRDDTSSPSYTKHIGDTRLIRPGTVGKFGTALFTPEGVTIAPRVSLLSSIAIESNVFPDDGVTVIEKAHVGRAAIGGVGLLDSNPFY